MVIVFDLDGTVLNTFPLIRLTLIDVFTKHLNDIMYDEDTLKGFFGPPLFDSFYKLVQDEERAYFLIKEYRKHLDENKVKCPIKPFEGTSTTLEYLSKKHHLAILSNKIHRLVIEGLSDNNLDHYFDIILGIDDLKKPKPDPNGIDIIKSQYPNELVIYIGDTISDIITAKNAKVISVGVSWALTTYEEFKKAEADYIVENYDQLLKLMEELDV